MLLAKTPRVFKTTWKGMLAVALGCAALCGAMKCDLFGVVRRVPAPDSVKLVNVYAAGSNYYLTPGKDDALIEKVRTLHQTIIDDKDYIMSTAEGGVSTRKRKTATPLTHPQRRAFPPSVRCSACR